MIDTKEKTVRLGDFLRKEDVHLGLNGTTQLEVMCELVSSLGLDAAGSSALLKATPATGIHGIDGPRSRRGRAPLPQLQSRPGFTRRSAVPGNQCLGAAMDGEPVRCVFLLAAPHVSPDYLPILAKIAHVVNNADFRRRLDELQSADEFFQLLADAGV